MAEDSKWKDGGYMLWLCSVAAYRGAGMVGVQLGGIGGSPEKANESGFTAVQESPTRFCGFPFVL